MTAAQLNMILAQAKRDVEAGKLPREVSAELCNDHGLNWMFIAPMINAFKTTRTPTPCEPSQRT